MDTIHQTSVHGEVSSIRGDIRELRIKGDIRGLRVKGDIRGLRVKVYERLKD